MPSINQIKIKPSPSAEGIIYDIEGNGLENIIDSPTSGNTGGIVENATKTIENYDLGDGDIVTIIPNQATGDFSHAEGVSMSFDNDSEQTVASGFAAHVEGMGSTASGEMSHAEGTETEASNLAAHAEGGRTVASGEAAHAEGATTTASGDYSHTEGFETSANGVTAHAEGIETVANGNGSHVEGYHTSAGQDYQHVSGTYNDNKSTTLFEIGNGTSSARSNAFEVYADGTLSTNNGVTKVALENLATTAVVSKSSAGLTPQLPNETTTTKFLRQDGTWAEPSGGDVSGKADKVTNATNGNFAGLDASGNLTDSGSKASDFATASHNQASNTINAMTGYSKASTADQSISTSDSLNTAIGKLEKTLDGKTSNVGTITSVKMNGTTVSSSGEADLGTVITSHQDISGKADKSATVSTVEWDSTNNKITKTINGNKTDVVTGATILGGLTKTQVTTALGYTPPTTDTNTHRPIQLKGTQILGDNTTALNFAEGSNISLTNSGGTITIASTASSAVTGVKGNSESSYRTGNVNITADNIGLGNVENKSSATIRSELTSSNVTTALGYTPASTDTNTVPSAYCTTSASTAAKTATCTNYALLSNSYIHVTITTSNTKASALTLNINSKGAKSIYINGTASSSTNYTLPAGTYLVFYDGTNYYFRTDGKITTTDIVDTSNLSLIPTPTVLTQTLSAGNTQVTFNNTAIGTANYIDIYTNKAGLNYEEIDTSVSNTIKLTYDAQDSNVTVKLVIN